MGFANERFTVALTADGTLARQPSFEVYRDEIEAVRHEGFRPPEQQEPALIESKVQPRQHPSLRLRVEIHQRIAAGEQVDAGDRRVVNEIMPPEDHLPAQILAEEIEAI